MADKKITRFITLVFDQRAANKAEREAQESLRRATEVPPVSVGGPLRAIGRGLSDIVRLGAQAAAAVTGYSAALFRMTERGGEVINVQHAFTSLVGNQEAAIDKLRAATMGLVSDYDLMREANMAISLGAARNVDDFAKIAGASLKLGRALGVDANKAMHDLSIGIARGSKRILDNLGIVVDGAITVDKVMEAVDVRVKALGGTVNSGADQLLRMKIAFTNLRDEIARWLAESTVLRTWFYEISRMLEAVTLVLQSGEAEDVKDAFKNFGTIVGGLFVQAFATALAAGFELMLKDKAVLSFFGMMAGAVAGVPLGLPGIVAGAATGALTGPGLVKSLKLDMEKLAEEAGAMAHAALNALGAQRSQMLSLREMLGLGKDISQGGARVPTAAELELLRKAEDERLKSLIEAHKLRILDNEEWQELLDIYTQSAELLEKGNLALEDRLRLTTRMNTAGGALGLSPEFGLGGVGPRPLTRQGMVSLFPQGQGQKTLEEVQMEQLLAGMTFFEREMLTGLETIKTAAEVAGLAMQQAFQDAFDLLIVEGEGVGAFMEALFRGIASAAIGAIAEYAAVKVKENMARAAEALVLGLLGDASKFAAIGAALKAAAAWALVGGAAGSAAAGLSGGTGGAGRGTSVRDRTIAGRQIDAEATMRPVVYVQVDGIDPDNPRHIELVHKAAINGVEQWGAQKPTTRRYTQRRMA